MVLGVRAPVDTEHVAPMQGDGMTHVTSVPHRQGAPPPLMFPLPGFPILQLYCLPASLTMIQPAAMTPPTMPESAGRWIVI